MEQDLLTMLFGEAPGEREMRARNLANRARAQALRNEPAPQEQEAPNIPVPSSAALNPMFDSAPGGQGGVPGGGARQPQQMPNLPQPPAPPLIPPPQFDIQQPRSRALPRALGVPQKPPAAPGSQIPQQTPPEPAGDIYAQRQQELERQMQDAMQPPDMSGAQAAYDKQARSGGLQMALAAMAGEAGDEFKPFQAQHLKQAAAAREPMKMAGGTMTDTGFIEDPVHKQEFKVRQLQAQIAANDRIIQSNAARADKIAAEKRADDLRRELQQNMLGMQASIAGQASLDRRYAADLAHPGGLGAGPKMSAGDDKEITETLQGISAIDNARRAIQAAPGAFGAGKGTPDLVPGTVGRVSMALRDKTLSDPELAARNAVFNDVSKIITARAGTAQSASEQRRLESFLPGPLDNANQILVKLNQYEEYLRGQGQAVESKYGGRSRIPAGQPQGSGAQLPPGWKSGQQQPAGGLPPGWSVQTR